MGTRLEERLHSVEDQLAIYQVISRYGPAADAGATETAANLWAPDGLYEVDGVGTYVGRDEVAGLLDSDLHQAYIDNGSAHLLSLPYVVIDDDTATAINHAQLALWTGDGFHTKRIVASHWELARTALGWKVTARTNVLLDGSEEGHNLLRRTLNG